MIRLVALSLLGVSAVATAAASQLNFETVAGVVNLMSPDEKTLNLLCNGTTTDLCSLESRMTTRFEALEADIADLRADLVRLHPPTDAPTAEPAPATPAPTTPCVSAEVSSASGAHCIAMPGSLTFAARNWGKEIASAQSLDTSQYAGRCVYWEITFTNEGSDARMYPPYTGVTNSLSNYFRVPGVAWGGSSGVWKTFSASMETEGVALPGFDLGHGATAPKLAMTMGMMMDYTAATPTLKSYVNGKLWHTDATVGGSTVWPLLETTNDGNGGANWAGAQLNFADASLKYCR